MYLFLSGLYVFEQYFILPLVYIPQSSSYSVADFKEFATKTVMLSQFRFVGIVAAIPAFLTDFDGVADFVCAFFLLEQCL